MVDYSGFPIRDQDGETRQTLDLLQGWGWSRGNRSGRVWAGPSWPSGVLCKERVRSGKTLKLPHRIAACIEGGSSPVIFTVCC